MESSGYGLGSCMYGCTDSKCSKTLKQMQVSLPTSPHSRCTCTCKSMETCTDLGKNKQSYAVHTSNLAFTCWHKHKAQAHSTMSTHPQAHTHKHTHAHPTTESSLLPQPPFRHTRPWRAGTYLGVQVVCERTGDRGPHEALQVRIHVRMCLWLHPASSLLQHDCSAAHACQQLQHSLTLCWRVKGPAGATTRGEITCRMTELWGCTYELKCTHAHSHGRDALHAGLAISNVI